MKKKVRNKRLALKMASMIGMILIICFTVLIITVGIVTYRTMTQMIEIDFNNMADGNASRIQSCIDEATLAAKNIQTYIIRQYDIGASMTEEEKEVGSGKSMVLDAKMNGLNIEVENFMVKQSWGTIQNSENIMGMGANFEPYKYDSKVRSYAYYINEEDAKEERVPFLGEYEEYCNEVYYQKAKEALQPYFTEPYEFEGIKRVICSFPIVYQNEFQGIITVNVQLDRFKELIKVEESYPTMYSSIFTQDGIFVYDTDSNKYIGKSLFDLVSSKDAEKIKNGFSTEKAFSCYIKDEGENSRFFFIPIKAGENTWWSLTSVQISDMNRTTWKTLFIMIIFMIIILVVVITITVRFLHKTISPLQGIVTAANHIMEGKLDIVLKSESEDEIGQLTLAFSKMADNLKQLISDISGCLGEMAQGNFEVETQYIDIYVGEYKKILIAAEHIKERLNETLSQINQSADQVAEGSDQVAAASQSVSEGTTEQASAIQELAATVTEISDHIKRNAENAKEANKHTIIVEEEIIESNQKMNDMLVAISDINQSSQEIENIIKTIRDIAEQTNLLSLNAAIEAARAGDAGKGFAVVAQEVGQLAVECAEASNNTSALIQTALQAVNHGTTIADETAAALTGVVSGIKEITQRVEQISSASDEQANSVSQVTQGIEQISNVIQNNSATAQESAASSEELSNQAKILKELVKKFQLKQ